MALENSDFVAEKNVSESVVHHWQLSLPLSKKHEHEYLDLCAANFQRDLAPEACDARCLLRRVPSAHSAAASVRRAHDTRKSPGLTRNTRKSRCTCKTTITYARCTREYVYA